MITAKVIADSINPAGDRITTGIWTFPRFILCEINTHRMLAKNTSSSRAIPVEKMIDAVWNDPATFEQYGKANKGMAAQELMDHQEKHRFEESWKWMGYKCAEWADKQKDKAAKQMVNRALEPWMWTTQIVTGTDWFNVFSLRAHPAAQPEFQVLAYRWLKAYLESNPVRLQWGDWHLPFIPENFHTSQVEQMNEWKKVSVARCARVSYTRHEQIKSVEEDVALHDRMLGDGHMSPFEHQAQARQAWANSSDPRVHYYGCYRGWCPYRKFLPNENRTGTREDLEALLRNKPDWITL